MNNIIKQLIIKLEEPTVVSLARPPLKNSGNESKDSKKDEIKLYKFYYLESASDPGEIRYLGVTSSRLCERMSTHRQDAKDKNSLKCQWMQNVYQTGGDVKIVEFWSGMMTESIAEEKEIKIIKEGKERGLKLTNSTDGGKGTKGHKKTDATKKLMSEKMTGKKRINKNVAPVIQLPIGDEGRIAC
jgi:hypothetical protein